MNAALRGLLLGLLVAAPAHAQLIGVKTVPIAAGEQFVIFPTSNFGFGGPSLAVDNPIGDVFANPAKGARLRGTTVFGIPTYYAVSGENGGGRTLPVSVMLGGAKAFGGVTAAAQLLDRGRDPNGWTSLPLGRDRNVTNAYGAGYLGAQLGRGWAVGASGFLGELNAADGVDQLYAGSARIDQSGQLWNARVGIIRDLQDRSSFELVAVHSSVDMRHDVLYIDPVVDDSGRVLGQTRRMEENLDRTSTTGLHAGYRRPLGNEGARIGGIFTVNRKSHPKIPNYEIQNIPRDPGTTWAYNFGLGIARTRGANTWGVDLIYEPIRSETWQEADSLTRAQDGSSIAVGGRTIENAFAFTNAVLRGGLAHEGEKGGYHVGMQVRVISYTLDQRDHVLGTARTLDEGWNEFTPSWGGFLKFPEMTLRYSGYLTTNGVDADRRVSPGGIEEHDSGGPDIIAAARRPLDLPNFSVWVHQLSVSIPVGRR